MKESVFTAALLLAISSAGNDVWALSDSRKKDTRPVKSPQSFQWKRQPAVGFHFVADPTSVNTTEGSPMCMEPMTPSNWTGKRRQNIPIHPFTGHAVHR